MLWFLFTAIAIFFIVAPPTQASNLSPTDLKLIEHVADSSIVTFAQKDEPRLVHSCSSVCRFLQMNATTGGDCFTLFLTTPTCLQCLRLPRHKNETLLATALTALDICRNGTTDMFGAVNITKGGAPEIVNEIFNFTVNATSTLRRRESPDAAQSQPCPLWLGEPSDNAGNTLGYSRMVSFIVLFVGVMVALMI